jgi:sugar transferase (PEP-CTERM/EpsH1 system associated)
LKILFLVHGLPNLLNRVRLYNILKSIYKEHEIHILSLEYEPGYKTKIIIQFGNIIQVSLPKFKSYLNCICNIFSSSPFRVAYCKSLNFYKKLSEIISQNKFDLIYVKRLRMAQFVKDIKDIPLILDITDSESLLHERMIKYSNYPYKLFYKIECERLKEYEKYIVEHFNKVIVSSEIDKKYLERLVSHKLDNVICIPNVVDEEFFTPVECDRENAILFSGLMDRFVNIDAVIFFVKEIFPKIEEKIKDVKLYIVGPNPSYKIRKIKKSNTIITGEVDDIRKWICKSKVVVAPVRIGAGMRNKILQAMAMEKPVVATSLAAEGIEYTNNENIIIADEETFSQKVVELLQNENEQIRIGKNARKLIENKYSISILKEKLNKIFCS